MFKSIKNYLTKTSEKEKKIQIFLKDLEVLNF